MFRGFLCRCFSVLSDVEITFCAAYIKLDIAATSFSVDAAYIIRGFNFRFDSRNNFL